MNSDQKKEVLKAYNIIQLRNIGRQLGINKFSSKKKAQLIDDIMSKGKIRTRGSNVYITPSLSIKMQDRRKRRVVQKKIVKKPIQPDVDDTGPTSINI